MVNDYRDFFFFFSLFMNNNEWFLVEKKERKTNSMKSQLIGNLTQCYLDVKTQSICLYKRNRNDLQWKLCLNGT